MKQLFFLPVVFLMMLINGELFAQKITNPFLLLKEKRQIIYGLDNRRTHFKSQPSSIYGIYTGIGFGGKLRFKTVFNGSFFELELLESGIPLNERNRMFFVSLGEEFDFFTVNKFGLTTYVQMGLGKRYSQITAVDQSVFFANKEWLIPLELGLHSRYDLLNWLTLKIGGGWRFVFPDANAGWSGYYLKFAVKINGNLLLQKFKARSLSKCNAFVFPPHHK